MLHNLLILERLTATWNLLEKLPIQPDIRDEMYNKNEFRSFLEGDYQINNENQHLFYYYLKDNS